MISILPKSLRATLPAVMSLAVVLLLGAAPLRAADVGSVRGVVHDQQHRIAPVVAARKFSRS